MSLDQAIAIFVAEMKAAKTNIDLIASKKSDEQYVLSGKHVGKNSKFFHNYFEKAFAFYTVSAGKNVATGKRTLTIEGLYNLLISAEPSPDAKDYRDFGTPSEGESHLAWFQGQVLSIVEKKVMSKVGSHIACGVIDVD
jgi:hypothetical protein